jgi:hypothetical protein
MNKMYSYFYLYNIHLTTLPVTQTAYGRMVGWSVNNKSEMDVEGRGRGPFQHTNSALVYRILTETTISLEIVGIAAEIRTGLLPNTSPVATLPTFLSKNVLLLNGSKCRMKSKYHY